jgi:hypothetical protein
VTGASGPGISSLASQKFAANTSKSHSQVRPGGIFSFPVPSRLQIEGGSGWPRPAGAEALLRRFSCPAKLMIISLAYLEMDLA